MHRAIVVLLMLVPAPKFGERHPIVLFDDAAVARERIAREPYATWWKAAQARADVKSAAFVAAVTGRGVDSAVRELLAGAVPEGEARADEILEEADVARDAAISYDLLHGFLSTKERVAARDMLARWARRLAGHEPFSYRFSRNHRQVRQYACLGLLSIVLADHREAGNWRALADRELKAALEFQICGDGAVAEGHSLFAFAAEQYLPYFHAARRAGLTDWFSGEPVRRAHEWSVLSRLPGGRRPNFDDAHLGYFPSHWVPGGLFRWDWENLDVAAYDGGDPVQSICFYDDTVAAEAPKAGPAVLFEKGGDVVFRGDWSKDALYVNVRAETGQARAHGRSHEHADNLSFQIWRGATPCALDSGTISFERHFEVMKPEHHNLVLVDGQGPSMTLVGAERGEDVRVLDWFTSDFASFAELETEYRDARIRRTVYFLGKSWVAVVDRCTSERPREWTVLWHAGPGDEPKPAHGGWSLGVGWLAFVSNVGRPEVSVGEATHSFESGRTAKHPVFRAVQRGRDVSFVTWFVSDLPAGVAPILYTDGAGTGLSVDLAGAKASWTEPDAEAIREIRIPGKHSVAKRFARRTRGLILSCVEGCCGRDNGTMELDKPVSASWTYTSAGGFEAEIRAAEPSTLRLSAVKLGWLFVNGEWSGNPATLPIRGVVKLKVEP